MSLFKEQGTGAGDLPVYALNILLTYHCNIHILHHQKKSVNQFQVIWRRRYE